MINGTKHEVVRCETPSCICCHCEKCNWSRANTAKMIEVAMTEEGNAGVIRFNWTIMQVPWLKVRVL